MVRSQNRRQNKRLGAHEPEESKKAGRAIASGCECVNAGADRASERAFTTCRKIIVMSARVWRVFLDSIDDSPLTSIRRRRRARRLSSRRHQLIPACAACRSCLACCAQLEQVSCRNATAAPLAIERRVRAGAGAIAVARRFAKLVRHGRAAPDRAHR